MAVINEILFHWLEQTKPKQRIIVAFSGGCDSHGLLHALWQCRQRTFFNLSAIHVNDELHPDAIEWENHCKKICAAYELPLKILSLPLTIKPGDSIEEVARVRRYAAFAQMLTPNDILLTAHTQDDQAETFFLQLARGSGLPGLAGIAATKALGQGQLARPLLAVKKADITAYAKAHQLVWIEDSWNKEVRFRRNFLRHELFPKIQTVYPSFSQCVARTAHHCAASQQLLDEYLHQDFLQCRGQTPNTLQINALKSLSPRKYPFILRYWLTHNGIASPSTKKLNDLMQQMLYAKGDARPCVSWQGAQVRRYRDLLYVLPQEAPRALATQEWDLQLPLQLADGSQWQASLVEGQGIAAHKLSRAILKVSYRKGGERCRVARNSISRPLKKLLQEYAVPAWQRASLPLFYHEAVLVGVGDLFLCEDWQVKAQEEKGWVIKKY